MKQEELFPSSTSSPASEDSPSPSKQSWPTPDHQLFGDGQTEEALMNRKSRELEKKYNGNGGGIPLATRVRMKDASWPTARTSDGKGGARPTEMTESGSFRRISEGNFGANLSDAVNVKPTWATPTQQDSRIGPDNIGGAEHRRERGSVAMADQVLFEQSGSQRSMSMHQHDSQSSGPMFPTSGMFEASPEIQSLSDAVYSRLSSLVDFLASRTHSQESEVPLPTSAIYGMNVQECFGSFDPSMRSSRTSGGFLLLSQDFFSTEFCQTWPSFGTLVSGRLYQQKTLERHIDANESGSSASMSWLTPKAMEVESDPNFVKRMGDRGDHCHPSLTSQVKQNWPTAVATDAVGAGGRNGENSKAHQGVSLTDAVVFSGNSGARPNWPTARREDGESAGNHPGQIDSLTGAVRSWPTPTVQDGENNGGPSQHDRNSLPLNALVLIDSGLPPSENGLQDRENLSDGGSRLESWATPTSDDASNVNPKENRFQGLVSDVQKSAPAGKLNPSWVETLMGYPIGHSQLSKKFTRSPKMRKLLSLTGDITPSAPSTESQD